MENLTTDSTLEQELGQFTGTENYYKFFNLNITDGVKYLAEKGKCWWLLDVIFSYQPKVGKMPFQLWELKKSKVDDRKAIVTCREDSDKDPVVAQRIPYTDFPLESIKLYLIDKVVLLPSEY